MRTSIEGTHGRDALLVLNGLLAFLLRRLYQLVQLLLGRRGELRRLQHLRGKRKRQVRNVLKATV